MHREFFFREAGWGAAMGKSNGVRAHGIGPYSLSFHLFSKASGVALVDSSNTKQKYSETTRKKGTFLVPTTLLESSSSSFLPSSYLSSSRHLFTSSHELHLSSQNHSASSTCSAGFNSAESPSLADAALAYTVPPPRPLDYISPEERGVEDASLEFLPNEHPRKKEFMEHRRLQEAERLRELKALRAEEEKVGDRSEMKEGDFLHLERTRGAALLPPLGENQLRAPTLARWSTLEGKAVSQGSGSGIGDRAYLFEEDGPTSTAEALLENTRGIYRGEFDEMEKELQAALAEAAAEEKEEATQKKSSLPFSSRNSAQDGNEAEEGGQETAPSRPFLFSSSSQTSSSTASSSSSFSSFYRPSLQRERTEHVLQEEREEKSFLCPSSSSFASKGSLSPSNALPHEGKKSAETSRNPKSRRKISLTRTQEMELAAQKLEYYFGTPQYPGMLASFREKYAAELHGEEEQGGGLGNASSKAERKGRGRIFGERVYTEREVQQGLDAQPIDYLRSSKKLQMELHNGPRAYDPITMLQRQGWMRFQGYAFPPSTELGTLKLDGGKSARGGIQAGGGDGGALSVPWEDLDHQVRYGGGGGGGGASGIVRRSFFRLLGKEDPREAHLVRPPSEAASPRTDNSLVYRVTGMDVVQRRQVRYMLTDFDYSDRQTAFHVMMTYPFTDWIHVFYMVSVGVGLYWLQVHFNAYDFYDEYLGLDLRQVPSAKKPFLAALTTVVMVYLLFQPLLVASIATTRLYRIIRRRPIGPP